MTRSLWPIYLLLSLILVVLAVGVREQHNALAWREFQECQDNQFMRAHGCTWDRW